MGVGRGGGGGGVVAVRSANSCVLGSLGEAAGDSLWALKSLKNPGRHRSGSLLKGLPNLVKKVAVGEGENLEVTTHCVWY